MIDRVIARTARDVFVDDYTPDQAVTAVPLHNPSAENLAAIFPPWHGGGTFTDALVKRLVRSNFAVLDCKFHDQILEPHAERVPQSFSQLKTTIAAELQKLKEEWEYKRIHLIGISLGNVAMTMTAGEFDDFSDATMVLAGSNLASAMWDGVRTQGIANALSEQGYTKAGLDEAWQVLAPKAYAPAFKHKNVRAIISRTDRVIPASYQYEMRDELEAAGVPLDTRYTWTAHAATITRFCMSRARIE